MKKWTAILMVLFLLLTFALAEFNTDALKTDADLYAFTQFGTVDTVYRAVNQPYIGQVDEAFEGGLVAYVDFVTMPDLEATLLRMMISTEVFDLPLGAQEVRLTVGGKRYTLPVSREEAEYDGLYMEDFTACLVGEGLNMLKAIAQQKQDDPIPVELLSLGETVFSGMVIIPGEEAANLHDRFVDLGGKTQGLKKLEELFPCKAEKVK